MTEPDDRGEFVAWFSACWRGTWVQPRGHRHKARKGAGVHLAHHLTAVRLHRDLADAEFAAHLLIQQTGDDQRHHLPLAGVSDA